MQSSLCLHRITNVPGHLLSIVSTNYTHYFSLANAGILSCAPALRDNAAIGLDSVSVDILYSKSEGCKQNIFLGTETSFEHLVLRNAYTRSKIILSHQIPIQVGREARAF